MNFLHIDGKDLTAVYELSRVATEIVRDYYDPLLGKAQNDYMLAKFQSPAAILEQIAAGYRYYLCRENDRNLGFMGFYPRNGAMYLSKLYLYADARGKGHGREMLSFLIDIAAKEGLSGIQLNVNKHNPTIAVYEKMGFKRIASEKNDIGNGYYMDDYVYELKI